MWDCCSNSASINTLPCPDCGGICKGVAMRTLYHQVRFPENLKIVAEVYYFCPDRHCKIGYFSVSGNIIAKQLLTACRGIQADRLCYCFGIDADQYLSALRAGDAETIKGFVIQRTQAGECACEVRNPSGQCCLAKFKKLEQNSKFQQNFS
jgi:hypothetical protein